MRKRLNHKTTPKLTALILIPIIALAIIGIILTYPAFRILKYRRQPLRKLKGRIKR
jgi:hypothetical protein